MLKRIAVTDENIANLLNNYFQNNSDIEIVQSDVSEINSII